MAVLRIPDDNRTATDPDEIRTHLAGVGIDYERWAPSSALGADPSPEELLDAYAADIERLKAEGGYTTADVIDLTPETPNLDVMLAKFSSEHAHDEDEVRLIIEGRGIFHLRPPESPVLAVEVQAGDFVRVPRGTKHWFDLCGERRIRAIRLFQDPNGWTPLYTDSGVDRDYQPVCLGPATYSTAG
jgi:1,2-dihydroxy-3-keto-5-methylthiopentene dioxygenase